MKEETPPPTPPLKYLIPFLAIAILTVITVEWMVLETIAAVCRLIHAVWHNPQHLALIAGVAVCGAALRLLLLGTRGKIR